MNLGFEDYTIFRRLYVATELVHLYEASRKPYEVVSKRECSWVVDCGFSFTHCVPVFQNFVVNYGVKRMNLGGNALSNYLKELISCRSVNVMDESFLVDHVKEKSCFVSLDVQRDFVVASVEDIHPTDIATIIDQQHGVAIRSGHHCAQPLHCYLGINASARARLYFYNTKQDVDEFINALKDTISFFSSFK